MKIDDPEVRLLASISQDMEVEYKKDDSAWEGSPFAWILPLPSRQKGAIGERPVAGWLAARGFNVTRSPDSDADRLVEGRRVEVKLSTLWGNGVYKFQQLRDQDYELAICLGISPFTAHCWVLPKEDIMRLWKQDHVIPSQHGGAAGADTAWLSCVVGQPPDWMTQYGGTLGKAICVLSQLTGFKPQSLREQFGDSDI